MQRQTTNLSMTPEKLCLLVPGATQPAHAWSNSTHSPQEQCNLLIHGRTTQPNPAWSNSTSSQQEQLNQLTTGATQPACHKSNWIPCTRRVCVQPCWWQKNTITTTKWLNDCTNDVRPTQLLRTQCACRAVTSPATEVNKLIIKLYIQNYKIALVHQQHEFNTIYKCTQIVSNEHHPWRVFSTHQPPYRLIQVLSCLDYPHTQGFWPD